ncbi:uncharacterized protein LOC117563716 [Drosophila albomicans]|uniref:Uncharacterized protein LOC117563716 n=1 Tax=Drosophila albomicans TaxID=7291 RepID=A0A6P8W3A9_DROAB|nr:uncharacterized protein LOC117563716 [Drosophila albomicans]
MDDDINLDCLAPPSTNTFAIPNEPDLLVEYELYKASMGTRLLNSECNRETFSEAFIEHERLGTLADLCVRALAKLGTRHIAPPVRQDPLKLRIHYDSLDVNLPLKDCYFVDDLRFWRRVVLAKSADKTLVFKKIDDYDWRGMGISLKYVELVEACPAEYWPENQMADLAALVRQHVRSLHIRHLQSMTENSFAHYVESDPELDVTSDESDALPISSDECDSIDEEAEQEDDSERSSIDAMPVKRASSVRISIRKTVIEIDRGESVTTLLEADKAQLRRREARAARNTARRQLRNLQQEKQREHERRKQNRALLRKLPEPAPASKKKRKQKLKGVFDMIVAPEPDEGDDDIADKRNKHKLLDRIHRYDYPSKHCHHIDLRFVRFFDMLDSLTLEFLGPEMERDYHKRHMNFSTDDMVHLAMGLVTLQQLKTFRLRNSRMDAMKMLIVTRALRQINALEVVDFGYDQLEDDSSVGLEMLLDRRVMIKQLELEYNKLGKKSVDSISFALKCHSENNPNGTPLQYLGLAHNLLGDTFISHLIYNLADTNHIQELNINGAGGSPHAILRDVCHLLRGHAPLRRLWMAGIDLQYHDTNDLICSLFTNQNVVEFDCRGCGLDEDEEYEADVIVRRNKYQGEHASLQTALSTENGLENYLTNLRHPIVKRIENGMAQRADCVRLRPSRSSSVSSVKEEQQEEHQEQEYDIWKVLGVNQPPTTNYQEVDQDSIFFVDSDQSFVYNPSLFDLDQVREHMHLPGPGDRYYYFQKQTRPHH